jgi:hypothetical protein
MFSAHGIVDTVFESLKIFKLFTFKIKIKSFGRVCDLIIDECSDVLERPRYNFA